MATRSFLTDEQFELAKNRLKPFKQPVLFDDSFIFPHEDQEFSLWLGQLLDERLAQSPHWEAAQPVALGSWARNELCPKSDIDLLFCGAEDSVRELVDDFHRQGLKIRYRVPEDPDDWTVGVGAFDALMLLHARPFTWEAGQKLIGQQQLIKKKGAPFAKSLLTAMIQERDTRAQRYDSISNYLDPNIKYGAGGLRDLQQALYVHDLFAEKFSDAQHVVRFLEFYKHFYLALRQKLHLMGMGDVLIATEQKELAEWFGYGDVRKFMRAIQLGISRVSFYADWMVERAKSGNKRIAAVELQPVNSLKKVFSAFEKDTTVLMQGRVRFQIEELFKKNISRKATGRLLSSYINIVQDERFFGSLFRSQVLQNCLPEMKKVVGLVQHDQYHRFTVDTHILQCVREICRVHRRPKILGKLAHVIKELDDNDWKILLWTALYHDIAKGRGGSHSEKGAALVKKDFTEMGLSLRLTLEVAWMVENHLLLSTAAFRLNPQEPSTWRHLHEKGVKGKRLTRLAAFTAVDIRGTNPDAWNDWKETLLAQIVDHVRSTKATKFMSLLARADSARVKLSREFLRGLDPSLVEEVPIKYLIDDYRKLKSTKRDLPPLVIRDRRGQTWVRFHQRRDEHGLYLRFTQLLYSTGCRVRESSVQTYEKYGAYDWFKVVTNKTPAQLRKLFEIVSLDGIELRKVKFDRIKVVSEDEHEAIVSFRGRDQKGALIAAVNALTINRLTIRWARVHTWGSQIDDVFCVKKSGSDFLDTVRSLKSNYEDRHLTEGYGREASSSKV